MTEPPPGRQSTGRRGAVLQLLRDGSGPLGVAEIADRLGIHANTVRFHLDTLVANGQVDRVSAESGVPGRPAQLFRVASGMDPMGKRHYRALAEVLAVTVAADPDLSRRGVESGRQWGRRHASTVTERTQRTEPTERTDPSDGASTVDLLAQMLDELGFAPEQSSGGDRPQQITLRNCPFLELAVHHTDVVCPIHLGLMQGALESWDSPLTVKRLDPFVEPDRCTAHLVAKDHHVGSPTAVGRDQP